MKKIIFNEDINEALDLSKKEFNFKEKFVDNLKKNTKKNKVKLITFTAATLLFPTSSFLLQLLLVPTILISGYSSFSDIVFKGLADTCQDKSEFNKKKENARRILESFKRNVLIKNNIYVKKDCYLRNIGTYSKKKIIENIRIKKEEKVVNNYFKFKDRNNQIHVLRQIKKELLENGESKEVLSTEYELLELNEADTELKKEKGKIR